MNTPHVLLRDIRHHLSDIALGLVHRVSCHDQDIFLYVDFLPIQTMESWKNGLSPLIFCISSLTEDLDGRLDTTFIHEVEEAQLQVRPTRRRRLADDINVVLQAHFNKFEK